MAFSDDGLEPENRFVAKETCNFHTVTSGDACEGPTLMASRFGGGGIVEMPCSPPLSEPHLASNDSTTLRMDVLSDDISLVHL